MTKNEVTVVEHSLVVHAAAEVVFEQYLQAHRWPQFFSNVVHVQYAEQASDADVIEVWALRGPDAVRHWTSRRTVDREGLRVAFTNEPALPPMAEAGGEWSFAPTGDGATTVTVRHEFSLLPDAPVDPATVGAELAKHSTRQLTELAAAAENADTLLDLIVDFEDPLYVGGAAEDAWKMLYEADKWPERLAHVAKLTMTEEVAGIQFFDMDTTTSDGRPHTTRSVRVCLPYSVIVYKQLQPPPLLSVHTGHWRFTPTREGVIVGARHTVTINPERLDVLGAGATVEDARRYLRKVLSTNSMGNLRLAKGYAEEQRDA